MMDKETVKAIFTEKITAGLMDIMVEIQNECGIDDGGCPPMMEELLDNKIEELAEISAEIIKYQKGK